MCVHVFTLVKILIQVTFRNCILLFSDQVSLPVCISRWYTFLPMKVILMCLTRPGYVTVFQNPLFSTITVGGSWAYKGGNFILFDIICLVLEFPGLTTPRNAIASSVECEKSRKSGIRRIGDFGVIRLRQGGGKLSGKVITRQSTERRRCWGIIYCIHHAKRPFIRLTRLSTRVVEFCENGTRKNCDNFTK